MERPRPDGPRTRARTDPLFAAALLGLGLAAPALGASSGARATAHDVAIIARMNIVRAHAGLHPVRLNGELVAAARAHSREMADRGYFSHDSANGTSMASRVRASYVTRGPWSVGENLLWSSPRIGARQAVRRWMASPDHRAIILTAGWTDVGCASVHTGTTPGVFDGLPVTVVTCDFGAGG